MAVSNGADRGANSCRKRAWIHRSQALAPIGELPVWPRLDPATIVSENEIPPLVQQQLDPSDDLEALRLRLQKPGGLPCLEPGRILEPQLAELLLYLAARPGRIVDKHELFERVWKGKAITDEAIWRAVADLRRALGDDARSPCFIETVHRRGYRFVGSVREILGHQALDEPTEEAGDSDPDNGARQGPVPSHPPRRSVRTWLAGRPSRQLRIGALLTVALLLTLLGSLLAFQYQEGRSLRRDELGAEREWHLLLMVDNLTEHSSLTAATEAAVSVFLEQASNVSVARFSHMKEELARMRLPLPAQLDHATAVDLCVRERLTGLLKITILPEADSFRFIAEVTEAATREVIYSRTVGAESRSTFLRALDWLAGDLEQLFAVSSPVALLPLAKATTGSLEALILYSRADAAARAYDFDGADRMLDTALIHDPDFTLARARRAILQVNRSESFDFDGLRDLFTAESGHLTSFEKGYLRAWWQTLTSRHDAIASWKALAQRFPHRPAGWMNVGYVSYFWLADCEQAAAAVARAKKIPGVRPQALALRVEIGASLCLGLEDRALALAEALPTEFIDRKLRIAQVLNATGSHHEASALLREAAPELPMEVLAARSLGLIETGRLAAAKELLATGLTAPEATSTDQAFLLAYINSLESLGPSATRCPLLDDLIEHACARDLRSPFLDDSPVIKRALAGVIAARCGGLETASDLLAELKSPLALAREIPTEKAWTHFLEGEIQLASGHSPEAVRNFEDALQLVDLLSARLGLARAWAANGEAEQAARELMKITRQSGKLYRNPYFEARALILLDWHLAFFELGAALESLGRSQASRQAFRTLVEEWREMDTDLTEFRFARVRVGASPGTADL